MQSNNITTCLWCITYEGIKSLCCIPETNIIFLAYYIPIKKKILLFSDKKLGVFFVFVFFVFFFASYGHIMKNPKPSFFFKRNKFSQVSVQTKEPKTCDRSWELLQVPFRYSPGPVTCSPHQYTVWVIHTGISAKPQIIAC